MKRRGFLLGSAALAAAPLAPELPVKASVVSPALPEADASFAMFGNSFLYVTQNSAWVYDAMKMSWAKLDWKSSETQANT